MKKIALIGATGSVGMKVVSLALRKSEDFRIVAVASGRGGAALEEVKRACGAEYAASAAEDPAGALAVASYPSADVVFNAAAGFSGVKYGFEAVKAGKTLALANKETLVCGGDAVCALADKNGVEILPVDSEHSAIWQCLGFNRRAEFSRIYLTASGGPFRGYTRERLEKVTPAEALAHPVWKMGAKISVDSATMLNKGYEVIEAHHLFGADYKDIRAVIHPQGLIHSFVEFGDGAVIAQMSYPSMDLPVQIALYYPERTDGGARRLDFGKELSFGFYPVDAADFPAYGLALECGRAGGILPCALNAASEVAVRAFLEGRIKFTAIYGVLESTVNATRNYAAADYGALKEADAAARALAETFL